MAIDTISRINIVLQTSQKGEIYELTSITKKIVGTKSIIAPGSAIIVMDEDKKYHLNQNRSNFS